MRKILLFAIGVWTITLSAQDITFESSKYYNNNKTISYCALNFLESDRQASVYKKCLLENNSIYRLSFYDKSDFKKVMLEYSSTLNEDSIIYLVNKVIDEEQTCKDLWKIIPKYKDTGNIEEDKKQYQLQKKRWIEENPEKHNQVLNCTKFITTTTF